MSNTEHSTIDKLSAKAKQGVEAYNKNMAKIEKRTDEAGNVTFVLGAWKFYGILVALAIAIFIIAVLSIVIHAKNHESFAEKFSPLQRWQQSLKSAGSYNPLMTSDKQYFLGRSIEGTQDYVNSRANPLTPFLQGPHPEIDDAKDFTVPEQPNVGTRNFAGTNGLEARMHDVIDSGAEALQNQVTDVAGQEKPQEFDFIKQSRLGAILYQNSTKYDNKSTNPNKETVLDTPIVETQPIVDDTKAIPEDNELPPVSPKQESFRKVGLRKGMI